MRELLNYTTDTIYPGHYVPVVEEKDIMEELRHPHEGRIRIPPVNFSELPHCYQIEIAIPGITREKLFVKADGNILSVGVLNKDCVEGHFKLHEYNYACFEHHIALPENADTQFVSAEYTGGILRILIPKTDRPQKNIPTRIVVY